MLQKVDETAKRNLLLWYMFLLVILKIILAAGLYITAYSDAPHDDGLMVDMAYYLLSGEWLGPYNQVRLVKGITFPVFLALNCILGVPYHVMNVLLYGIACIGFINTLRNLISNQAVLGVMFTILYLIPANMHGTVTRIYRDALLPTLVLFVFTCFLKMYFTRRKKSFPFWAFCAGIALALFWNLREDSVWMLPFALAVILITMVRVVVENKTEQSKWAHMHLLLAVIPLLILGAVNTGIKAANDHFYGTFVRNELAEGSFPKLIKALYAISPEEDIFQVSVPRSSVEKAYQVSPTFRMLQPVLDQNYGGGWDGIGSGKIDGQIEDGWFFWCLRDCIFNAGYNTPDKVNEFCEQAAVEIQSALDIGQLPKRAGPVMPSALMSPWKASYATEWPKAMGDTFWFIAEHGGDSLGLAYSTGSSEGISRFEWIAHELALRSPQYSLGVQGWIISMNDQDSVEMVLYQGDNCLALLNRSGGEDVYDFYAERGRPLENAKNSRFSETFALNSNENLQISIVKNGTEVSRIPLLEEYAGTGQEGDGYCWNFDTITLMEPNEGLKWVAISRISIINGIYTLYHMFGGGMTMIALLAYFLLTAGLLREVITKRPAYLLDRWLVVSGLLFSVLVLCMGLSYTSISAYSTLNCQYTAGGKIFLTAFDLLSIAFLLQGIMPRFSVVSYAENNGPQKGISENG